MADADRSDDGSLLAQPAESTRRPVLYTAVVLILLGLAIWGGLHGGAPQTLPGAALQSNLVLFVERAVAIFASLFLVTLVVIRAMQGSLPQELSGRGVKYADSDVVDALRDDVQQALLAVEGKIDALADSQAALAADEPAAKGAGD